MFHRHPRKKWHPKQVLAFLHNHFVPHRGNHHHPHVLRHKSLFAYSVGLIAMKAVVLALAIILPSATVLSSAITRANIISLTNATRTNLTLPLLLESNQLNSAAQAKANDMLEDQYFSHTSPDGVTPWDWIKGTGYQYTLAGENLAVHYFEAEDVLGGWMASPTHKDNIVNERFSEIGVGVSQGIYDDFDTVFVVQMFGEPLVTATEPPPDPAPAPEPEPLPTDPETPAEIEPIDPPQAEPIVLPTSEGFEVTTTEPEAEQVVVQYGAETADLEEIEPDVWSGVIEVDTETASENGETLNLIVTDENGETDVAPAAVIAPTGDTADLYGFSAEPEPYKLFGLIALHQTDDIASTVYILTMIVLGLAILANVIIKIEHQRHDVLGHGLFVLLLAGFLAVL